MSWDRHMKDSLDKFLTTEPEPEHPDEFWIERGVCPECIHDMITCTDGQFCPECGFFTEDPFIPPSERKDSGPTN